MINITATGSPSIGQVLSITCIVEFTKGLFVIPEIKWLKIDDVNEDDSSIDSLGIDNVTTVDGNLVNSTLILDPVLFEYRGSYFCMAEYNETTFTHDSDSIGDEFILVIPCE